MTKSAVDLLSIITVCLNSESTILDAIKSVHEQTYKNIEHIIIDGGSVDKTLELIKGSDFFLSHSRILLISEPDKGLYDAMNKGISMSSGRFIGILNSDDIYHNKMVLNDVVTQFLLNPLLDIVYGDLVYVKSDDINKVVRYWKSSSFHSGFFGNGDVPPHPTLFLKRNVYDEAGLFNLEFKLAADYELMLRILNKYNFNTKYLDITLVKMRLGGATNKNLMNIVNQNIEILKAWKCNNLVPPLLLMPRRFIKRIKQFI